MSVWNRPQDFNELSYHGTALCAVCGSTKRDYETGIFRPVTFDDFDGFFDMCEGCITEAAGHLGFVKQNAGPLNELRALKKELHNAHLDTERSQAAVSELAAMNAALNTTLEELNAYADDQDAQEEEA